MIMNIPFYRFKPGAEWVSGENLRRLHSLYVCIFQPKLAKAPTNVSEPNVFDPKIG